MSREWSSVECILLLSLEVLPAGGCIVCWCCAGVYYVYSVRSKGVKKKETRHAYFCWWARYIPMCLVYLFVTAQGTVVDLVLVAGLLLGINRRWRMHHRVSLIFLWLSFLNPVTVTTTKKNKQIVILHFSLSLFLPSYKRQRHQHHQHILW